MLNFISLYINIFQTENSTKNVGQLTSRPPLNEPLLVVNGNRNLCPIVLNDNSSQNTMHQETPFFLINPNAFGFITNYTFYKDTTSLALSDKQWEELEREGKGKGRGEGRGEGSDAVNIDTDMSLSMIASLDSSV